MAGRWWADDGHLIAVLGEAFRQASAVPDEFVEAAKSAYTWRTVDAELARPTCD
jgi:hypothetical protein